jgi:hypothetical protein
MLLTKKSPTERVNWPELLLRQRKLLKKKLQEMQKLLQEHILEKKAKGVIGVRSLFAKAGGRGFFG